MAPERIDVPLLGLLPRVDDAPAHPRSRSDQSVSIVEVFDGTSTLITWGVLNLTHRHSHETPEPLVPGETFTVTIRLNDIGRRVARRSRHF